MTQTLIHVLFYIVPKKIELISLFYRNKSIYILTSVLEPPFLMEKQKLGTKQQTQSYGNDRFEGYTVDLAEMLAEELNLEFEIRVVKDGQYGVSDPEVNVIFGFQVSKIRGHPQIT